MCAPDSNIAGYPKKHNKDFAFQVRLFAWNGWKKLDFPAIPRNLPNLQMVFLTNCGTTNQTKSSLNHFKLF
jgi:hypothetical protein